jgi:hydroxymethylbilane synthase
VHAQPLDPEVFVPAVGQGVLAVEARAGDRRARELLGPVDHASTRVSALAERACLGCLGASCNSPLAAHAVLDATGLRMTALVSSEDGRKVLRASARGAPEEPERLGRHLAEILLDQGAASVAPLTPGAPWRG